MSKQPYFVSLHHQIRLDENLPALGPIDADAAALISGAAGVLMPKYGSPTRYRQVARMARSHFPRLAARYAYRGKARQTALFRALAIPHPRTVIYQTPGDAATELKNKPSPIPLPFVLKGDSGGGGSAVFPIRCLEECMECLTRLPRDEPVLVQEWIENSGRDLRVVVMGHQVVSYFRVGGDAFYNNVSKGARIDFDLLPETQQKGRRQARALAQGLGIDLAAFDIMFPACGGESLVVEINFLFGRKGLGGLKGYERLFRRAILDWMQDALSGSYHQPTGVVQNRLPSLTAFSSRAGSVRFSQ